jgi:phosphatidylglycerophosphate synthase
VARLGLVERWQRVFADRQIEVAVVTPTGIATALAATPAPASQTLLVWADWVIDPAAVDSFVEAISTRPEDEVCQARTDKNGFAPLLAIGSADLARLAAHPDMASTFSSCESVLGGLREKLRMEPAAVTLKAAFWGRVTDRASARRAVWQLLVRLRWRQGGAVAHYLNRPVSMVISHFLVETRTTPNQVTFVTFLIGIVGVALLVRPGGYWGALAAMLVMHVNSVLDGVDGELARLRHQSSSFGAYLDSVCDEILNSGLMIALGYNLAHDPRHGWPGYLYLGIVAASGSLLYALVHWHCKWKHGLGLYWWWKQDKPRKKLQLDNSLRAYLSRLFIKDSFLFLFLVAAVVDLLPVMLLASTVSAVAGAVLLFLHVFVLRGRW